MNEIPILSIENLMKQKISVEAKKEISLKLLYELSQKASKIATSKDFVEKYKGVLVIIDEKSRIAELSKKTEKGVYALKY